MGREWIHADAHHGMRTTRRRVRHSDTCLLGRLPSSKEGQEFPAGIGRLARAIVARPLGYTVPMPLPSDLSFAESLRSERRREFYEGHRSIAVAMILIVFLAPFVGLVVRGLAGVVWGVVLSAIAYCLAPYVVLKLRA